MKQRPFVLLYLELWQEYEVIVNSPRSKANRQKIHRLPQMHHAVANHYALAKSRNYTVQLINYLEQLLLKGNAILYQSHTPILLRSMHYLAGGFAQDIRFHWKWVTFSLSLFFLALAIAFITIVIQPSYASLFMDDSAIHTLIQNYSEPVISRSDGMELKIDDSAVDFFMFAFYIYNNIGLTIQAFMNGALLSFISVFILIINGLHLGAALGVTYTHDIHPNLLAFVIGHGTPELLGIIFSFALALKVSYHFLVPLTGVSRWESLTRAGKEVAPPFLGCIFLVFLAAWIEAFWSAQAFSNTLKMIVGSLFSVSLIAYFLFAGRHRSPKIILSEV